MNAQQRSAFFRRALLGVWAMATLVLVFCLILLVGELIEQGHNPLARMAPASTPPPPPATRTEPAETTQAMKEVSLYFAGEDGALLAPESRQLRLTEDTVDNCRQALRALIEGPRDVLTPVLPPGSRVRALYMLEDGELVVDLSIETVLELRRLRSVAVESLLIHGVTNTLTQSALVGADGLTINRIRFLVEGSTPEDSFQDSHLDLSAPIQPDESWVAVTEHPGHG